MQSFCVMMSFCQGTANTGQVCSLANPCLCIVGTRPVQPATESGLDGFPNGKSVRRAAEHWGANMLAILFLASRTNRNRGLELHVRNWNHIVRAVGSSSKGKTSDARRIPPVQDGVITNHPAVPAVNPSSRVAACLVARQG